MTATPQLRRRPSRVIPAAITAAAIVAVGALLLWAGLERLATGIWPTWAAEFGIWLAGLRWNSPYALGLAVVVTFLGLLLILSAVVPGKRGAVAVRSERESRAAEFDVAMSRKSVARLAAARADLVDGVDSVTTTVTAKTVRLSVTTPTDHTEGVRAEVVQEVRERLRESGVDPLPQVVAHDRTHNP